MEMSLSICLKNLKLPGVKAVYQEIAKQARAEHYSYEKYLAEVLEQEWEGRRNHRIERYLKLSNIPLEKNIESFNRNRLPQKADSYLSMLLTGTFVEHTENVLAFGNPGSGNYRKFLLM